mmetsp:Transcript_59145/g.139251  ORF Transcript_59145/g.139251 Transcript_59145/m.139251 type:complete len:488 (-) Transcript_59145:706-2169(-)
MRTLVDQRREADQRLAALAHLQQLGQLTKGPVGVGLAGIAGRLGLLDHLGPNALGCDRCRCRLGGFFLGGQLQGGERLEGRTRLAAQLRLQRRELPALAELAAMLVHHAEVHEQMRRELLQLEVVALHRQLGALLDGLQQHFDQPALTEGRQLDELGDKVRQRGQPCARLLVQAFQQRRHLLRQHARHQPLGALLADLVERKEGHGHRQPVARVAGLVQVVRRAIDATEADDLGKGLAGDACGLMAHQLVLAELKQLVVGLAGLAPPLQQRGAAEHVGRQLVVVEGVDQLVVDQHVLPARLVFQRLHLRDLPPVVADEGQLAHQVFRQLVIDQALADEDLSRGFGVHTPEVHALVAVQHDAVKRRALQRDDLGGLLLPVRLQQLGLDQVAGDRRQPLRLDVGETPAVEPRGVDQLGRDDPAPRLLAEVGARVAVELDAARAEVPVLIVALLADIAQQAGQHGQVDLLVGGGALVEPPAMLGDDGVQL